MGALVRPATDADAPAIARVYAPYVTGSVISFESTAPDADEMARRMRAEPRMPWLVATRSDRVVGYAYASPHGARAAYRWAADCSVYLEQDERRRGTARLLYGQLLPLLRDLGYVTAHAGVTLPNDASVGFHESTGFVPVGVYRDVGFKHGAWHPVGWWQLRLTEPPPVPREPRAWDPAA